MKAKVVKKKEELALKEQEIGTCQLIQKKAKRLWSN